MTEHTCQMLVGKTLVEISRDKKDPRENDELRLVDSEGGRYRFYHDQDCCESVWIEDVSGDLADLLGSPILMAEESISNDGCTWTFYKFATKKGYVTVRWCGESNGYYSESVYFEYRKPKC